MNSEEERVQNGNDVVDDYSRMPIHRTTWEKIRIGIYNPDKGTYLYRTPISWAKIGLFYLTFYCVLISFCGIYLYGWWKVLLSEVEPRWTLEHSIIGTNPGLGFRPMSEELALISYKASSREDWKKWPQLLNEFFETEHKKTEKNFGNCKTEKDYGYPQEPCVFIKLNQIYGWIPECYTDGQELPNQMPQELKTHIQGQSKLENNELMETVWMSCEITGLNSTLANIRYYAETTSRGFPSNYYPYNSTDNYSRPLVAVQFIGLPKKKVCDVVCRAWAKNIQYSHLKEQNSGVVRFAIRIDD